MKVARWTSRVAFLGAASLAVVAFLPGTQPSRAADKPNVFSVTADARGIEALADTNPAAFPVTDVADETMPLARSNVQAGGVSDAHAQSVSAGGLEGVPGLICLFLPLPFPGPLGQFTCNSIPKGLQPFPPPYPFAADASYPVNPSADAPVQGTTFGAPNGSITNFSVGPTHATANIDNASAVAGTSDGGFMPGTVFAVTAGSIRSTTDQHFEDSVLVTRGEATLHDVSIANTILIKNVTAIAEVHNDGTHKPVNKSSVTVSGVSVKGVPASIDDKGIHLGPGNGGGGLTGGASAAASKALKQLGISVQLVGVQSIATDAHTLTTTAEGVVVNFTRTFKEVCTVNPALCPSGVALPPQLCKNPIAEGVAILIDLCNPSPPNPRSTYIGRMLLGVASAGNSAQILDFTAPPPTSFSDVPTGTGPTTTFIPGTPGTPGTPGFNPSGSTLGSTSTPPSVAGTPGSATSQQSGFLENFSGVSGRLKYLFPCLLLAVIGFLAGRFRRAPARIPEPTA